MIFLKYFFRVFKLFNEFLYIIFFLFYIWYLIDYKFIVKCLDFSFFFKDFRIVIFVFLMFKEKKFIWLDLIFFSVFFRLKYGMVILLFLFNILMWCLLMWFLILLIVLFLIKVIVFMVFDRYVYSFYVCCFILLIFWYRLGLVLMRSFDYLCCFFSYSVFDRNCLLWVFIFIKNLLFFLIML